MHAKRMLENSVRALIANGGDPDAVGQQLADQIEMRVDDLGNFFFVRKGAPIALRDIAPSDRVDVKDIFDWKRPGKRRRFLALESDPHYRGPIAIAEGDSWFEYPLNRDLIDWAGTEYAILSLARAGDTWSDILDEDADPPKYYTDGTPMGLFHNLVMPRSRPFQLVALSAGGNDLIGQIVKCVYDFDPARPEEKYVNHAAFYPILRLVLDDYLDTTRKLLALSKKVVLHTYDYPNPTDDGPFIGYRLRYGRNIPGVGLMRRIVNEMIDAFYEGLQSVAATSPDIHLVDLRNTIGTSDYIRGPDPTLWADEMHGTSEGYRRLWEKLRDEIRKIYP